MGKRDFEKIFRLKSMLMANEILIQCEFRKEFLYCYRPLNYGNKSYDLLYEGDGHKHYGDSTWAPLCLKSLAIQLFIEQCVQAGNNETSSTALLALCKEKPPVGGDFSSQRTSNAESVMTLT